MSEKIIIPCRLKGQELSCSEKPTIYTWEQNYIYLKFTFDEFWEKLTPRCAVFSTAREDQQTLTVLIDSDGTALVPWELLTHTGTLYVSVYGGDRLTTGRIGFAVCSSGYDENSIPSLEPSKDALTQLAELAGNVTGAISEHNQSGEAHLDIRQSLAGKVDAQAGKVLSSNDYTNADKAKVDALGNNIDLNDNAGNTLDMQADGSTVIDTTKTHPAEAGATLGVKMALANLATDGIMGRERGITFSMQRRLSGADQTYIGYLLTTGMLEIRYGTTGKLDNSGTGVKTVFSPAMSNAPQIVLLTPKTGVAGVAAPKVVSMDKTGFYATLGGSTGTDTVCYYLAIRFNYRPN